VVNIEAKQVQTDAVIGKSKLKALISETLGKRSFLKSNYDAVEPGNY
tara:strand:+ start:702 stop:842 length:141 start_codon:yes stop_codon:yes gene_type:complete